MAIDHWRLIQRKESEIKKLRFAVATASMGKPGDVVEMVVEHEEDNRCCKKEAWSQTVATVVPDAPPGGALWVFKD